MLCGSFRYDKKNKLIRFMYYVLVVGILSALTAGCGPTGYITKSGPDSESDSSGPGNSNNPENPTNPQRAKPTGVEVVSAAGKKIRSQNGAEATISMGTAGDQSRVRTANGFQVFLSVSGQNSSQ